MFEDTGDEPGTSWKWANSANRQGQKRLKGRCQKSSYPLWLASNAYEFLSLEYCPTKAWAMKSKFDDKYYVIDPLYPKKPKHMNE